VSRPQFEVEGRDALIELFAQSADLGIACWWVGRDQKVHADLSHAAFAQAGRAYGDDVPAADADGDGWIRIAVSRAGSPVGAILLRPTADAAGPASDPAYLRSLFGLSLSDDVNAKVIEDFTEHLAQAFENIQLLYRVGKAMSTPDDPAGFSGYLVEQILDATPFRWAAIVFGESELLLDGVRGRVFCGSEIDGTDELVRVEAVRLAEELRERGGIFYNADAKLEVQGTAHVVLSSGEPVGMLVCGGKQGHEADISSYDTQLLEASASHLGSVLETARLYEQQATMFLGTISSLIRALDAKDPYTRGHSDRVAALARQLARTAGLGEKTAERYHIAGLLHDVGKIGVPEAVLCKPGRLTDEEFGCIMRHPEIGFRILDGVPGMEDLLPGVMHHHERYDGKGYPSGLAGEDIPLIARVLCLADTFDAMSSNRAYRSAMTRDTVLAEIAKCAGSQFDPELAPMFVEMDFDEYDRMVARHVRQAAVDGQGKKAA